MSYLLKTKQGSKFISVFALANSSCLSSTQIRSLITVARCPFELETPFELKWLFVESTQTTVSTLASCSLLVEQAEAAAFLFAGTLAGDNFGIRSVGSFAG